MKKNGMRMLIRFFTASIYICSALMAPFAYAAPVAEASSEAFLNTSSYSVERVNVDNTIAYERQSHYYDIPLSDDLQDHIFNVCAKYEFEPTIVFALIERETRWNENAVGDHGRSVGLMQIQERWVKDRMKRLGVHDLSDPYSNIAVGIDILSDYLKRSGSIEWALMAYNGGGAYANRKLRNGEVSNYAKAIMENSLRFVRRTESITMVKSMEHISI